MNLQPPLVQAARIVLVHGVFSGAVHSNWHPLSRTILTL